MIQLQSGSLSLSRYISGSVCLCQGEERNNRYISLVQYVGVRVQGVEKHSLYLWLNMSVSRWREKQPLYISGSVCRCQGAGWRETTAISLAQYVGVRVKRNDDDTTDPSLFLRLKDSFPGADNGPWHSLRKCLHCLIPLAATSRFKVRCVCINMSVCVCVCVTCVFETPAVEQLAIDFRSQECTAYFAFWIMNRVANVSR